QTYKSNIFKKCLKKCVEIISLNHAVSKELSYGYQYDFDNKTLTYENQVLQLSRKEILFFELLLQNRHRVVSYEELQSHVWKDVIMTEGALKSLLRKIRQKFPKDYIKNYSGLGYKLL
ncbi:MAG: winged helix-turn-helix domain-containing protein, partial [Sulfurospirillum cavolei]|nr:winged helix-turn-helix domain-containing protein [Sulfurospirillum cavolei]